MQIYEIWRETRKAHNVQVNDVLNVLLELGLATFAQLPDNMRHAMFKPRSAKQQLELQTSLDPKIRQLASRFRLDERLIMRIPGPAKDLIREEARRGHTSMSEISRRRIITKELKAT